MKNIFLAILFFSFTGAMAQPSLFSRATNWDDIFSQAQKQNKLVLIDCYFEGCHPCKQMDVEVFPQQAVRDLMQQHFVSVNTDILKEDFGKAVQLKYGITGFPTYLILNTKGQLVNYFSGYKEADKFVALLNNAVDLSAKGVALKGFALSLEVAHPAMYTAFFKEHKFINSDSLDTYWESAENKMAENCVMPLLVSRSPLSTKLEDYVLNNYSKLVAMYGNDLVSEQRLRIINRRINNAPKNAGGGWFESFLAKMQPLCSAQDWPYIRLNIAEAFYYNLRKDHKQFFKYAITHPNDDENKVRYLGIYIMQDGVDAEEKGLYIQWMKEVLTKHSGLEVLTNAAALMLQQNDKEGAKTYAQWALQKATLNHIDTEDVEALLKKINA